jgi:hypothetical protein
LLAGVLGRPLDRSVAAINEAHALASAPHAA